MVTRVTDTSDGKTVLQVSFVDPNRPAGLRGASPAPREVTIELSADGKRVLRYYYPR